MTEKINSVIRENTRIVQDQEEYQKKEDTLRNLYEKKKEKLISYICFLASLGLKVTILFSVILNFLIFPVSESLNLYSNSSTHSLMRYKSIKQLKTKIQEDIY